MIGLLYTLLMSIIHLSYLGWEPAIIFVDLLGFFLVFVNETFDLFRVPIQYFSAFLLILSVVRMWVWFGEDKGRAKK